MPRLPKVSLGVAIVSAVLLQGCVTAGSGVVAGPPGVNRYSFRECLLANGFLSREALSGLAYADWVERHGDAEWLRRHHATKPMPTAAEIESEPDARFILRTTRIIASGLMPGVEYWSGKPSADPANDQRVAADPEGPGTYVLIPGPQPYPPQPAAPGTQPYLTQHVPGNTARPDWRLNRYLDCYVGEVGSQQDANAEPGDGDWDSQGRLLRAHILVAILARFGTEIVISHASTKQTAQAERLLSHIIEAETAIRRDSLIWNPARRAEASASGIMSADDKTLTVNGAEKISNAKLGLFAKPIQPQLTWFAFSTRLLKVFQLGVDIEGIDLQQSLDRLSNIVAASQGPLKGFSGILNDALGGFATVQKTRLYGDAYLRDARETLRIHRRNTERVDDAQGIDKGWRYNFTVERQSWALWDEELRKACQVLTTVAQKDAKAPDTSDCVPTFDDAPKAVATAGAAG